MTMWGRRIAVLGALLATVGCGDKGRAAPKAEVVLGPPMAPQLTAAIDSLATAEDIADPLAEILRHDDPRAIAPMVRVMLDRPEVAHAIRLAVVSMPALASGALLSLVRTPDVDVDVRGRSALLLGDMRSRAAVASLVAEADAESPIVGEVLDALRMIGDSRGAVGAERVWKSNADPFVRVLALDVFSYVSSDPAALPSLATVLADAGVPDSVRAAAGMAYGRLVYADDQLGPLLDRQAELARLSAESAGAGAVNSYLARQRVVAQHLVRATVGALCVDDAACYATVIARPLASVGPRLEAVIPDLVRWTARERATLAIVAAERAFLELGKLGDGARSVLASMLERVGGTDPLSRQGALLVIARAAERPCDQCAARLDEIAAADRGDPALLELREETEVVRAYLMTQP
jgi:hypothetical protein